jgi:hypothetical protein
MATTVRERKPIGESPFQVIGKDTNAKPALLDRSSSGRAHHHALLASDRELVQASLMIVDER